MGVCVFDAMSVVKLAGGGLITSSGVRGGVPAAIAF